MVNPTSTSRPSSRYGLLCSPSSIPEAGGWTSLKPEAGVVLIPSARRAEIEGKSSETGLGLSCEVASASEGLPVEPTRARKRDQQVAGEKHDS